MRNYFVLLKDYLLIQRSGLFDSEYYFYNYPDVRQEKINPIWHFIQFGWREGRNPSLYFDTKYYLANNEDVQQAGINPLSHWLLTGLYQQREPSPFFQSPKAFNKQNIEGDNKGLLSRYLTCILKNKNKILKPEPRDFSFQEDKDFIDRLYQKKHGHVINYVNPRKFTEKMQIYKLYYREPILQTLANKFLLRQFIADKLGEEYLVPLIAVYDDIDSMSINNLTNQFVIKVNHGSGWNIICRDKSQLDWDHAKFNLNQWLHTNYYWKFREWCYKNIPPKIIVEALLLDEKGKIPSDYKVHCFNGLPKMIEVHFDRFSNHRILYLDLDWNILPFHKSYKQSSEKPPKPANIQKIIEFAGELSKGLPFVRVDFYLINEKPYIGEMTFHPGSGFSIFHPQEWDEIIGAWFDISDFYQEK